MLPPRLVTGLAVLVATMWAINLVVGLIYPGRNDPAVSAIFMVVIGAVFALQRRDKTTVKNARRKLAEIIDPKPEPEQDDRGDES